MNAFPIREDAVVLGLLSLTLGLLFYTRSLGGAWARFYTFVPIVLLCYLIPSLMNSFGIITVEGSRLWTVATNYFLPASLILLTLSIDLKAVMGLGPKALIMFFTATAGIVLGGPVAVALVALVSPEAVAGEGPDAVWRGLATIAGSWIGGGANQTAMLEIFQYSPEKYGAMVAVDIVVANIWMALLLYGAGNPEVLDRWLRADTRVIDVLRDKMANFSLATSRATTTEDLMKLAAIAMGGVGLAHGLAGLFSALALRSPVLQHSILSNGFFWVVVAATTVGLGLSFTRLRNLEGAGASKIGTVFIFLLVAVIGTRMDLFQVVEQPMLFVVGVVWMLFHTVLLFVVAKLIRAPFFFIAIGSKANVGGAASAPVVAAAFHPSLAPVGVLLAVLGYALGTYGAIACAQLMRLVAPV